MRAAKLAAKRAAKRAATRLSVCLSVSGPLRVCQWAATRLSAGRYVAVSGSDRPAATRRLRAPHMTVM
jgi:hypothetical protein